MIDKKAIKELISAGMKPADNANVLRYSVVSVLSQMTNVGLRNNLKDTHELLKLLV